MLIKFKQKTYLFRIQCDKKLSISQYTAHMKFMRALSKPSDQMAFRWEHMNILAGACTPYNEEELAKLTVLSIEVYTAPAPPSEVSFTY